MSLKLVTLLTDFGHRDPYVACLKGVMLSINPNLKIVDITHEVPKFNIRYGALILKNVVAFFPPQTIHMAVVDPGVGSGRRAIIVETEKGYFLVGPDNGLLYPAAIEGGIKKVVEITNEDYFLKPASITFAGRDVFAPVAAYLTLGMPITRFGNEIDDMEKLLIPVPKFKGGNLEGEVIAIDSFGNIITNITQSYLIKKLKVGNMISVNLKGKEVSLPFVKTYSDVPKGNLLALIDSFGYFEISINMGSAADLLKVEVGDKITLALGGENNDSNRR